MIFDVSVDGRDYRVELQAGDLGAWECTVNGEAVEVNATRTADQVLSIILGGRSYEIALDAKKQQIAIGPRRYAIDVRDPRSLRARRSRAASDEGPKKVVAPMPGKVVRIVAPPGTEVEAGAGVIVIEAMKMQNELKAPKSGRMAKVLVVEGAAVNPGDVLAIVE